MMASTSGRAAAPCARSPACRPAAAPCASSLRRPGRRDVERRGRLHAVLPPDEEKGGGTGLLEKPLFDRSEDESKVLPDNYYGSTDSGGGKGLGGGDWRVLLLDSPTHTEELVVKALTTTIGAVDETQARNAFNTSRQLGQALVISCLKEHAEFFTQMLNRAGVRSIIEPDTTTL